MFPASARPWKSWKSNLWGANSRTILKAVPVLPARRRNGHQVTKWTSRHHAEAVREYALVTAWKLAIALHGDGMLAHGEATLVSPFFQGANALRSPFMQGLDND